MKTNLLVVCVLFVNLVRPEMVSAQWSSVLREGLEVVIRGSSKAARQGVREGIEHTMPRATRIAAQGSREASEAATRSLATQSGRVLKRELVQQAAGSSRPSTAVVAELFGSSGTKAIAGLSKESGEQLAQLAPDLARSPYGKQWMATIATHGDRAVTWLWQRKGSLAVGTVATAVLLRPADFLQASEQVAQEAIQVAGKHVMQPLIEQTASNVAEPLIREAAVPLVRQTLPLAGATVVGGVCLVGGWYAWQRRRRTSP